MDNSLGCDWGLGNWSDHVDNLVIHRTIVDNFCCYIVLTIYLLYGKIGAGIQGVNTHYSQDE